MTVTREEIDALMQERVRKLTPEEVNYQPAPEGSAMRCASCFHMYLRAIDAHSICELIRSEEIDNEGIKPNWRCLFWTVDSDVTPLAPEEINEDR